MSAKRPPSNQGFSLVFIVLILLLPITSSAVVTFERTYGGSDDDYGRSVQQTSDGGYIVGGWTESFGAGYEDTYLVKTDSLGNTLWERTYGGFNADAGNCVVQTMDGGYIVAGWTESFGAGYEDVFVVRTDSLGDTLWQRAYGGGDTDVGISIQQTTDGGYIVVGGTWSFGPGYEDVYLLRIDSLGDTVWTETYGDSALDGGRSVRQTADGGYVVAGWTESYGAGFMDVYLVKTDSLGNMLWDATCGGDNEDYGFSIQQTQDGGYIVAGVTRSLGAGGEDFYLVKTDSLGTIIWEETYGGIYDDRAYAVQQTVDGGYVVAGWTESVSGSYADVYFVKTDSTGYILWERICGGSYEDFGYSAQQTLDSGYVICGWTYSFGAGYHDVYVIKTDGDGLTGIEGERSTTDVQRSTRLFLQNSPNPFQNSTVISYSLPSRTEVTLQILDVTGGVVETLQDSEQEAGIHRIRWNGRAYANGLYFCRLEAGGSFDTRKIVLLPR